MPASTFETENLPAPTRSLERGRGHYVDRSMDRSLERHMEREPKPNSWMIVAAGAVVPLGVASAAVVTTYLTTHERVAMTAWIAVAVVGSASVISAAVASSRRSVSIDRQNNGEKSSGSHQGVLKDQGIAEYDDSRDHI